MLQRFLTQPRAASREDMDYLMDKLDQLRSQAQRVDPDAFLFI